ncbi:hypothetical protein [Nonomuraea rubra]
MKFRLRSALIACAAPLLAAGCGSSGTGGGASVPADASPALRTLIEAAQD